jgi:ABC-type branched-subunit amino acid transport system permease subunit
MVILGGQGSLAGVTIGAVVVNVMLEFLRDPGDARILFYVVGVLAIAFAFGRTRKLAIFLASLVVFGFAAHAVAKWINPDWVSGTAANGFDHALSHWLIIPTQLANWVGPVTYIGLVCLVLALTLMPSRLRYIALVPTLYLGTFVWENVLLAQPDSTRYIVLGVMLIGLMILRPNGLLGERRVEII